MTYSKLLYLIKSKGHYSNSGLTATVGTPATTETFAKVRKLTTARKSVTAGEAGSSSRNTSNNSDSSCLLFRGMVWNGIPRVCFYFCFTERNSELFLLPLKGSEGNSKSLLLFYSSCLLFRGMVWNGIPRVCFYFCFTERNSELFLLPLKGSEGNSKSLLLFLFHRTDFRVPFSTADGSEMNSKSLVKFFFCGNCLFSYFITYIHSTTFIQYIYPSPFAEVSLHLLIACKLSGKTSL